MSKLSQIAVLTGGILAVNAIASAAIKLNRNSDEGKAYVMPEGFTVTAHTGSMGTTDNTIHSIVAGIESGADVVEFDINDDGCGNPVLSHNKPVGGEPALEDAYRILQVYKNVRANLDIKVTSPLDKLQEITRDFGLTDRVFFTGIGTNFVADAQKKAPDIPYYLNYSVNIAFKNSAYYCAELAEQVKKYGALGLNIHHSGVSQLLIDTLHKNGLQISVWTVNHEKDMKNYLNMGVDNITTERPDKLIKIMKGN